MAELLLELLTEEIPARMQGVAAEELRRLTEIAFNEAHLTFTRLTSFVTPRRLALHAEGLPLEQPGSVEEKRGPRVGAAGYNAVHAIIGPLLLAGFGMASGNHLALAVSLIWVAHIGFDRAIGAGLKYATGFGDTHINHKGRLKAA